MTNYKTGEVATSLDYPYGRLRCRMDFWVEFKPGKGFRAVTQSTNPKNGRVNKPHYSTYSPIKWLYEDIDGHFKFAGLSFWGVDGIKKGAIALQGLENLFNTDQWKDIFAHISTVLRGSITYGKEADRETLKAAFIEAIEGFKTGNPEQLDKVAGTLKYITD